MPTPFRRVARPVRPGYSVFIEYTLKQILLKSYLQFFCKFYAILLGLIRKTCYLCDVVPFTEATKAEGRERHIYNKGVYCALCLTHRNLAHFRYCQEHGNSGCPTGCVMSHPFCWCTPVCQWIGVTFISGVGFRVARSTVSGNARASMRGTSDGENSHAFLYVYVNQKYCLICSFGSCGHLSKKTMEHRLLFEHLMRNAFDCQRAEFSFANADYYDAGIDKHREMKIIVVCAILAMAQKRKHTQIQEKLRNIAKVLDDKNNYTLADVNEILDKLHIDGLLF